MKISWGVKITVLYSAFVILIICMVSMAMRQKVDLESKDYYEQEIKFQDKINTKERTNKLKKPLTWEVNHNELLLKFPEQFKGKEVSGSIYFFRPSDASLDKTIAIAGDTILERNVSTQALMNGLYKMQITWTADNVEYLNEGIIQVR